MSGVFMDGGSHDGGGHEHGGHDHGGHDHSHHGAKHNFISHLLGLDKEAHMHEHGGHEQGQGQPPSQSSIWTSALQGIKLTDALRGIQVTPNFLWLMLFLGFFGWLFVVYWIRHHEPLANQVLGTGTAHSSTGHDDRRMIAGIREAYPLRTAGNTGTVYVPNAPPVTPAPVPPMISQPLPQAQGAFPAHYPGSHAQTQGGFPGHFPGSHAQSYPAHGAGSLPQSVAPYAAPPAQFPVNPYQQGTMGQPLLPAPQGLNAPQAAFGTAPQGSQPPALYVPIHSGGGTRLKTVVNR